MRSKQKRSTFKAGWRVPDWSDEFGCGKSYTNRLIKEHKVKSVKVGAMRIILTPPREFLESLAEQQAA